MESLTPGEKKTRMKSSLKDKAKGFKSIREGGKIKESALNPIKHLV